jgi:hypothetical protein
MCKAAHPLPPNRFVLIRLSIVNEKINPNSEPYSICRSGGTRRWNERLMAWQCLDCKGGSNSVGWQVDNIVEVLRSAV